MHIKIVYSRAVGDAMQNGQGIVALESTIITHGMPYPLNFHTAIAVEQVVRDNGAVPATIAVIDGVIRIGLSVSEIENLSKIGSSAIKISRRDIARVVSNRLTGSTTVAATMIFAKMAKIPIFATGGIGGVHRGAESSFDISADITELARTPVLVVCAGAKSILDLPKTVELLETAGVPVIGFKTNDFPAFFTPKTALDDLKTSMRCDSELQVAKLLQTHFDLGLTNGLLLTCPIPSLENQHGASIDSATREAVAEAVEQKISGKEITPFLLSRINEKTRGKSLELNIVLIKNNAAIAARIARHMSTNLPPKSPPSPITVIGGIIQDTIAKPHDSELAGETKTSSPGSIRTSLGGVGRNIAQTILQLGTKSAVSFHAFIGSSKSPADFLVEQEAKQKGWNLIPVPNHTTGQYLAVMNGDGSLCCGIVDMPEIKNAESFLNTHINSPLLILDCNLSESSLIHFSKKSKSVWVDCVSVAKCVRILACLHAPSLMLVKANLDELCALVGSMMPLLPEEEADEQKLIEWIIAAVSRLKDEYSTSSSFLITCGKNGSVFISFTKDPIERKQIAQVEQIECKRIPHDTFSIWRYTAPPINQVVDCTGAGDSMIGATAWAFQEANLPLEFSVIVGMAAARMTLMSEHAVSPNITSDPQSVIGKIIGQFRMNVARL